jgi:hypothetical protein
MAMVVSFQQGKFRCLVGEGIRVGRPGRSFNGDHGEIIFKIGAFHVRRGAVDQPPHHFLHRQMGHVAGNGS